MSVESSVVLVIGMMSLWAIGVLLLGDDFSDDDVHDWRKGDDERK